MQNFFFTSEEQYCLKMVNASYLPIYRDGLLIYITGIKQEDLYEKRQFAYSSDMFISNGILYNVKSLSNMQNLEIPIFRESLNNVMGTTGDLAYVFQMKARAEEDYTLAMVMLKKAYELMEASYIGFTPNDYHQIVKRYWYFGEFDMADKLEQEIKQKFENLSLTVFQNTLKTSEENNQDLVIASVEFGTCAECAKLQNRVYSISGKSDLFPPLPKQVLKFGNFHEGCHHIFFPFDYPYSLMHKYSDDGKTLISVDPVQYSNRPFVDDRSDADKEQYARYTAARRQREIAQNKLKLTCLAKQGRKSI